MLIPGNGRYQSVGSASITMPDGRSIAYLRRRFLPMPSNFALLYEVMVTQGDRLDLVAARHIGDAEQFWRICDANGAMNPDDLTTTVGRKLRITLPEGIPATPNA
jgi:hypothetical protein